MRQQKNTFSILFYIRRGDLNKQGECPIKCRITIKGERETFSTHVSTPLELWDVRSGRIIGRSSAIMDKNRVLNDMQVVLSRHYYDILKEHGYVTCEMVKNAYLGITAKQESLIPIYKEFLEETKGLVGVQKSQKTYEKYERCYRRVVEFLHVKYKASDIALRDLKPIFLVDFEVFLATKHKCSMNTIYKFLQLLRMPILKAQRMGIVFNDPYSGYKMKKETVDRGYLKEEDVLKIAQKEINIPRLDMVRDIFVFSCFTFVALIKSCLIINKLQTNNRGIGNGLETTCLHHFA